MATDDQRRSRDGTEPAANSLSKPLLSRILVTWAEIMFVGFAGAAIAGSTSGPPQLVVYLAATLLTVGLLLYNVDVLVRARLS
ncbi:MULTISPECIES: hypothetical protein [Salinibaculum]|uniref:hypothetical protein n=1 Tax=Salinibaculum TaxID=2732368 RepID=UPI0030D5EB0D